jgi:DNA-binding NarL/FixJ family response regulator
MAKIKVMIVDDHLVVRQGLKQLIEIEDDIEVTAEAGDGLECLKLLEICCPDLIFMDIEMPGISGIETTRLVAQKYPQTKVVMLTIYKDEQYVTEAIRAGAKGYVLKQVNRDDLIKIIHHVMADQAFLDPMVSAAVFNRLKRGSHVSAKDAKPVLTKRELEVLNGIVAGESDRIIAESLFISEHTVRSHIKNLYRKFRVSTRAQAVSKALKDKIIEQIP